MKIIEVPIEELPALGQWRGWVDARYLAHEYEKGKLTFQMDAHPNEGGHFILDKDGLPRIAILGSKCYDLDAPTRPNQDASDLPLYDEVLMLADDVLLGFTPEGARDKETAQVVWDIQWGLIKPLKIMLVPTTKPMPSEDGKRELRGRILRAKFNAVTIWREGKLRKEATK